MHRNLQGKTRPVWSTHYANSSASRLLWRSLSPSHYTSSSLAWPLSCSPFISSPLDRVFLLLLLLSLLHDIPDPFYCLFPSLQRSSSFFTCLSCPRPVLVLSCPRVQHYTRPSRLLLTIPALTIQLTLAKTKSTWVDLTIEPIIDLQHTAILATPTHLCTTMYYTCDILYNIVPDIFCVWNKIIIIIYVTWPHCVCMGTL